MPRGRKVGTGHKVDSDEALQMLQEGYSPAVIAEKFGCSTSNIRQLRRGFRERGLDIPEATIPNTRSNTIQKEKQAPRFSERKTVKDPMVAKIVRMLREFPEATRQAVIDSPDIMRDYAHEVLIKGLKYDELAKKYQDLKNSHNKLEERLTEIEAKSKKARDEEMQIKLALQQDWVHEPLRKE